MPFVEICLAALDDSSFSASWPKSDQGVILARVFEMELDVKITRFANTGDAPTAWDPIHSAGDLSCVHKARFYRGMPIAGIWRLRNTPPFRPCRRCGALRRSPSGRPWSFILLTGNGSPHN